MEAIDISEWVIRLLGVVTESKIMDIRMCQCLIVKILFFLLWIIYGGQERFTGGYFAIYFAIWSFFHLYVILVEMPYIRDGRNQTGKRKTLYKIVDLIQVTLLLIYFLVQVFAYHQQNQFYLLTTMSLFFDLALNLDQIARVLQKGANHYNQVENSFDVNGGEGLFFVSIIIGCIGAFIMTLYIYQYIVKQTHQEFPFQPVFLILCMVGEWCFIIFIFVLGFKNCRIADFFADTFAKTLLVFLYGISIGLFNFYYSILLAIYCILKVIQFIAEAYSSRQSAQVNQEQKR